ncbi:MAG: starch-binding protein [Oscillospiraceae bacterium]|nr:starch-binding protein [Oscillospiraceae bacterium]
MKKLISLFLALTMVFSLAVPAVAAEDTQTIYFKNTAGWSSVYAYAWDASAAACLTSWPGTAMSKVEGETNIYSIEVSTAAINVIFNNGGGSQTDDLTIPTDGNNLYDYSSGTWSTYDSAGDTSDQTKGDVTASYTPTITINDVTVSEHADYPGAVSVDETNSTYTVTVPADVESVMFAVYISGENLDTIPTTSTDYQVSATGTNYRFHGGRYNETIGKIQVNMEASGENVDTYDLQYSTDGGTTWTDTGWDVVVKKAEAEAAEVSFDVMLKGVDSSGTEITDTWLGYLSNVAVDNVTPSIQYLLTGDYTLSDWIPPSGYQTPADISLTVTDTDGDGVGEVSTTSSHASVTTETIDGKTVYVITVTLEAETTEVSEAKWGASKDSLTGSGTLAEAIAAAEADSTVQYIQLQSDVTAESSFLITSGEFTIDLNGQTVTSDSYTFDVRNSGTKVTFADSCTTGAVTTGGANYAAISPGSGAEVLITGGSYSGDCALLIDSGSSAAITGGTFTSTADSYPIFNNGGTLTISGGTIHSGNWANVAVSGTTTITGGTFTGSGTLGNFAYWSGTLDLSGYSSVTGLKVYNYSDSDLAVSDENIKLPADYTFVDSSNNAVTTLTLYTVYTIAAVSGGEDTTAKITGVTVMLNGVEVPEPGDIKFTDSDTIAVIYKGENFANLTEEYSYKVGAVSGLLPYCQIDTASTPNTATVSFTGTGLSGSNRHTITYTNAGESAEETGYTLTYLKKGTELTTIYFNNGGISAWTNVTAIFYNSWEEPVGTAELSIVPGESSVYSTSAIPAWAYTVKFLNETDDVQTEIPLEADGNNQFDLADSTWTKFKATEHTTTSANISWGSMAFTYTDGSGWANDGSDGAGTVTVTNTGDTTFTAKVAYTAVTDYTEIEGSFDAASAELAAEASKTFTLTLKNQPAKAITAGTKIGSVTVTIE